MRKKRLIVIEKLIADSEAELKLMQANLEGEQTRQTQWSRRFAASGKNYAPKIRESY